MSKDGRSDIKKCGMGAEMVALFPQRKMSGVKNRVKCHQNKGNGGISDISSFGRKQVVSKWLRFGSTL
ncbi:MAG: hypothetical protein IJ733_15400 [Lachnospiraceae bacterium]|nr:hypothetical protein [Lachnospiraceae bacterium]